MSASHDPEFAQRDALIPREFAASIASIERYGQSLFISSSAHPTGADILLIDDPWPVVEPLVGPIMTKQLIEPFTQPAESEGNRAQRRRAALIARKDRRP